MAEIEAKAAGTVRTDRSTATNPNVAVVIVTWNRKDDISGVLEALSRQDYPIDRMDVVVVDNASTDGTLEHLTARWKPDHIIDNATTQAHEPDFQPPELTNGVVKHNAAGFRSLSIVHNHANHGGCGGFNTGFAFVERVLDRPDRPQRPDYVWLVDDDVDLPPGALTQLTTTAEKDKSIGLVGSRAVDFHNRDSTIETTIYFNFKRGRMNDSPTPDHPRYEDHQRWVSRTGGTKGKREFSGLRDVDVVSACSLLARWSAVQEVGFWDHRYFIYCDDADWCLRMAKAGHRVVCDLDAVVYHTPWHHKLTPARIYYSQRNIVWVIQKVFPPSRLRYATFRWLASILNDCLNAAFHRRAFHAEIIRRTAADIVTNKGGKLDFDSPPTLSLFDAFESIGSLRSDATIAVICTAKHATRSADELRGRIATELIQRGRTADQPHWVYFVRNDRKDASRFHDLPDGADRPERVVYSPKLRSKLRRQLPFIRKKSDAVVVFDQTCDFPLLRGTYNIHVDRKKPTMAQIEHDGFGKRMAFLCRWLPVVVRAVVYCVTLRPYVSKNKYG